jgi:putative transposase
MEVSTEAAYQWRRAWVAGGVEALASRGAPGPDPKISDGQLARLRERLDAGPAAAGYVEDQRWTLNRVAGLIATMFHVRLSVSTTWQVLHRMGFTAQMPVHRGAERDERAIARWRRHQWPAVKESRAGWARGSASQTSAARR